MQRKGLSLFRNAAAGAAVLAALFVSVAAGDDLGEMTVNFNTGVHSYVMPATAYQCTRDFQQCTRTIPDRVLWSPEAYADERGGCCASLGFCKTLVDAMVAGNLSGSSQRLAVFMDGECSAETAEASRLALAASVAAMPDALR